MIIGQVLGLKGVPAACLYLSPLVRESSMTQMRKSVRARSREVDALLSKFLTSKATSCHAARPAELTTTLKAPKFPYSADTSAEHSDERIG